MKKLHPDNQRNVHRMHINYVEENRKDENIFQVGNKINSQGKLLNAEKLQIMDNKTLQSNNINSWKLSSAIAIES